MAGSVGEGCLGSGVKWRTTIPGYGVQPDLVDSTKTYLNIWGTFTPPSANGRVF